MKLSKEELIDLLYGAGTDWGPSEYVYRAERVIDALKTNTLEIEGYEKSDWIKFDPADVDTFPPPGHYLCFSTDDGEVNPTYRSDKCTDEIFASLPHDMEYWRPLPNPPIETEGQ